MEYQINPANLNAVFMVPAQVVDQHIKLAGAVQLKVLLWAMRHMGSGITAQRIAEALSLPTVDVADALLYWTESGILLAVGDTAEPQPASEPVTTAPTAQRKATVVQKPSREEVIQRGTESEEIAFLLREAQTKFGRPLRQNEASTLVWLHDQEGMDLAVILMVLEYAKSRNKLSMGYVEKVALSWNDAGITTVTQAEERICILQTQHSAWGLVQRATGIDRRQPSEKELTTATKWVEEWKFGFDMLKAAYDQCVDHTGKFSLAYMGKVLESWHKAGVTTPDTIPATPIQPQSRKSAAASKGKPPRRFTNTDWDEVQKKIQNFEG